MTSPHAERGQKLTPGGVRPRALDSASVLLILQPMSLRMTRTLAATGLVAGLILTACSTPAAVSESPRYATAGAACSGSAGSGWNVALEVDWPASSALALVSGDSIATCLTYRTGAGFGVTSVGVGLDPRSGGASRLSYVTSMRDPNRTVLIGR